MVHSIRGIISFKSEDSLGLETGALEWIIDTTSTSLASMGKIGDKVKIYTHLHHKEDQMRLYGFLTKEERHIFLTLLKVNGVGPSLARKILSGTSPDDFTKALEAEDISTLGRLPGLGKKTAQKIILQLRGKLSEEASQEKPRGTANKEIEEALTNMGFESKQVVKILPSILNNSLLDSFSKEEREKEILRQAIIALSG